MLYQTSLAIQARYYDKLNSLIELTKWSDILLANKSIDENCNSFMTTLKNYIIECIPTKHVMIRPRDKPWFDSELRKN